MARPRMRPRFELELASPRTFRDALCRKLQKAEHCQGQVFRRHAVLHVVESARHVWSPNLNLEWLTEEGDERILHARFSPQPNVWTMFMAMYGVLLALAIAGLVWGQAQLQLDSPPWAFAFTPAAILLGGFLYGASFIGQGLSHEQMHELRSFVEEVARGPDLPVGDGISCDDDIMTPST